jgi:DNA-binding beta-propeller fold protein YncE
MISCRAVALAALLTFVLAAPGVRAAEPAAAGVRHPLKDLPITARVRVPKGPAWLETAFGSVWVAKIDQRVVLRIDPATNRVIARIRAGRKPELAMGVGLGSLWVGDTVDRTISRIDPATNRIVATLRVDLPDETEGSFAVGAGSLWVLSDSGGTKSGSLLRIDPQDGRVLATVRVRDGSHAAVFGDGAVWVTSTAGNLVSRVDPATNAIVAEIPVCPGPRFAASGLGGVWVLCQGNGALVRIDPATNRVAATVDVGVPGEGGDLSLDERYVWVSAEGAPLSQVDPARGALLLQYAGGTRADTMRVAFGAAWIVDELGGQIWRIDLSALPGATH